jgi:hypothetical protein
VCREGGSVENEVSKWTGSGDVWQNRVGRIDVRTESGRRTKVRRTGSI